MELRFTGEAANVLKDLADSPNYSAKLKKVRKTLGLLEQNPRHPGLNSHKYQSVKSVDGSDLWESYVENRTPAAWRIFWIYGPTDGHITIVTIGPPTEPSVAAGSRHARGSGP
ncbi:hypothetical protein SAMN02745244_03302 [Tessaracoccus bendigoensis DSM 12906]|uniref:Type II toxin-antitoxin system RelE/ParE family toxin n=1 Tax=Tessaracoccus bendigoensis DSM 12906 TaxID=1123357 RepID=A0A1M6MAU0_9ACTN|nr:hypothetical protein [Tessaracoccus bendigoensis]SHJ80569.1 hypothetical protein SAMN02745244_03302 [Tessaracoccus bendigoensis DSM 12906]